MALLFPDLEDEQEKDEEEEDYYDNVEEWKRKMEEEADLKLAKLKYTLKQ